MCNCGQKVICPLSWSGVYQNRSKIFRKIKLVPLENKSKTKNIELPNVPLSLCRMHTSPPPRSLPKITTTFVFFCFAFSKQ